MSYLAQNKFFFRSFSLVTAVFRLVLTRTPFIVVFSCSLSVSAFFFLTSFSPDAYWDSDYTDVSDKSVFRSLTCHTLCAHSVFFFCSWKRSFHDCARQHCAVGWRQGQVSNAQNTHVVCRRGWRSSSGTVDFHFLPLCLTASGRTRNI